ncbi:2-C-methyl-D-erythritol 4-phosphate cytidylyltransferase [Clostridium sp. USBA 49]|jgi:2-C-methyl-D-erythritol 4-phosphate cytidylyltransferase|uniref:2-C-methyl-D-erythritol 4-phosphate cytidylyltransferase n=1 Tax=Clostridium TaxID=1485 RepID=UPI0009995A0E|nr:MULTISPECIES: 2-C-methyl-D-erythritol 4-phosphate cytidylyltransferase [Clostridium]SKA77880.1 2-C-methyl-D-erythritol 4-phosphate cytidylyltransferase [Clostridium sp. USBA 49]
MDKVCAIIVAAGKGKRMGTNINKQFLKLKDKPILYYTLMAFQNCNLIDSIILVTSEKEAEYCKNEIIKKYNINKVSAVVYGGEERQHSVYNGLKAASEYDIVLIHDGARPFVDNKNILEGIKYAEKFGAAACGVKVKDTIKIIDENNFSKETLDRDKLFAVQTPQCFKYDIIFNCHKKAAEYNIKFTDDTSIAEYFGNKVYFYEGSYNNIKITTPEDLIIGEKILEYRHTT